MKTSEMYDCDEYFLKFHREHPDFNYMDYVSFIPNTFEELLDYKKYKIQNYLSEQNKNKNISNEELKNYYEEFLSVERNRKIEMYKYKEELKKMLNDIKKNQMNEYELDFKKFLNKINYNLVNDLSKEDKIN